MRYVIWLVVLAAVSVCIGCGQKSGLEGTVPVTGTVTYQSKPVEGASVTLSPQGQGRAASGKTDASGRFKLTTLEADDGALPGTYQVAVSKIEDLDAAAHQMTPEDMVKAISGGKAAPMGPTRPGTKGGGMKNALPEKYKNAQTSGLTAEVTKGGANDFKFDLVD